MYTRRSVLVGITSLLAANLLTGCQGKNSKISISLLNKSLPPQLLGKFRNSLSSRSLMEFQLENNLADIWKILEKQESSLVTLGDAWLAKAIQNQLIQPIPVENFTGWAKLPLAYQNLVRRNEQGYIDTQGKIWAAPYRWGTTMIAYRREKMEKLGWLPQDWSDLWREELRNRISLVDQPRELIGLTLKKMGYSYNQEDLSRIPDLESELASLNRQVKLYSSKHYLHSLILEDTWLTVGWSTDIIPITRTYNDIEAIVPLSGTALWADLWVRSTSHLELNQNDPWRDFINFCWQTESAESITRLTNAASPVILSQNLPQDIADNHLVVPDSEILARSEFLLPLPPEVLNQYRTVWQNLAASATEAV